MLESDSTIIGCVLESDSTIVGRVILTRINIDESKGHIICRTVRLYCRWTGAILIRMGMSCES